MLRFYATTKDTETASKNTVHFTAGNTKLQLPELPKVGDKTKPISFFFFIGTATHNYISLLCKPMLLTLDILPLSKIKPTVPFPSWRAALMNNTD